MCFDFLLNFCPKHFSFLEAFSEIVINVKSLCVKYRYSCQILIKREFSRQIFKKNSNMKFHQNSSTGSRIVPFGRTD
jgi:hypothetical protein